MIAALVALQYCIGWPIVDSNTDAGRLEVRLRDGKCKIWLAGDLQTLPRKSCRLKDKAGIEAEYAGVPLHEILIKSGIALGSDVRGKRMTEVVVLEATDGYKVLFSIAELEPSISGQTVILVDRKDGKPLDAKEGPLRIIVPGDKRSTRSIRNVCRLEVRNAVN